MVVIDNQLLRSFEVLEARLAQSNAQFMWATARRFKDYAWRHFDVRHVCEILIDERSSFVGHKEILFEALCAYVAGLGSQSMVRNAISLSVADHIVLSEKAFASRYGGKKSLGEIRFKLSSHGYALENEIYRPIGGLYRILQSARRKTYFSKLMKKKPDILRANDLMNIFQYASTLVNQKEFDRISFNRVRTIFGRNAKSGFTPIMEIRRMDQIWGNAKPFMALSYAASAVQPIPGVSLFEAFYSERHVSDLSIDDTVRTWLGMARYALEIILKDFAHTEWVKSARAQLPEVPMIAMSMPELSMQQAGSVRDALRLRKRKDRSGK